LVFLICVVHRLFLRPSFAPSGFIFLFSTLKRPYFCVCLSFRPARTVFWLKKVPFPLRSFPDPLRLCTPFPSVLLLGSGLRACFLPHLGSPQSLIFSSKFLINLTYHFPSCTSFSFQARSFFCTQFFFSWKCRTWPFSSSSAFPFLK